MKKLLKIEFERAFKNKMFFVSIIIGTFIAALHTYYKVWTEIGAIETILGYGKYSGIQLPGLYMLSLIHI